MTSIMDLCTQGYEDEETLFGMKKLALREVAENFLQVEFRQEIFVEHDITS